MKKSHFKTVWLAGCLPATLTAVLFLVLLSGCVGTTLRQSIATSNYELGKALDALKTVEKAMNEAFQGVEGYSAGDVPLGEVERRVGRARTLLKKIGEIYPASGFTPDDDSYVLMSNQLDELKARMDALNAMLDKLKSGGGLLGTLAGLPLGGFGEGGIAAVLTFLITLLTSARKKGKVLQNDLASEQKEHRTKDKALSLLTSEIAEAQVKKPGSMDGLLAGTKDKLVNKGMYEEFEAYIESKGTKTTRSVKG